MHLGASRFVAGESADEFLEAAKETNAAGFGVVAGILGEDTRDLPQANAAAAAYRGLLMQIHERSIDSTVALKATHLGLNVDKAGAFQNVEAVAATARRLHNFMRLDMEQACHVNDTLEIYRRLRASGYDNVGLVLQSYLYRSLDDLKALLPLGSNVRIVKGAYLEPATVASQNKTDVDKNYMRLLARSLKDGQYTAIATHDAAILQAALALISEHHIGKDRFEFQMLYGIATQMAAELRNRGYRVRLAIPFGSYWFPYLMRRLAERPANLLFFARNVFARG